MLSDEQKKRLNGPLPPSAVREREAGHGKTLSYVEGFYVYDFLNDVLGVDGWTYGIRDLRLVQDETRAKDGKEQRRIGYLVTVELLTYDREGHAAICVEDVGFGQGIDADLGKAHESAAKEAVTDGVKRAARKLGRACGLALYDKSGEHVAEDPEVAARREMFLEHAKQMGYSTPSDELIAVGATLKAEAESLGVPYEQWRAAFKAGRDGAK